jgi:hypothetical protein
MASSCRPDSDAVKDSPVYWFAVMEGAKERYDFALAQEALGQLRRLGVVVRFERPRPPRRRGGPESAA